MDRQRKFQVILTESQMDEIRGVLSDSIRWIDGTEDSIRKAREINEQLDNAREINPLKWKRGGRHQREMLEKLERTHCYVPRDSKEKRVLDSLVKRELAVRTSDGYSLRHVP